MKNLKDYQIIILIVAFFITGLTVIGLTTPKPTIEKENKTFVGVDAAGFKHGEGKATTIINH
jgi:hypothetical protein